MLEVGIDLSKLVNSQIFCYNIEFDNWPAVHSDPKTYVRPYDGNILDLRYKYK